MRYQNILVALDFSQQAERALEKAIEIAKEYQSKLVLTHILDLRLLTELSTYDVSVVHRAEEKIEEGMNQYQEQAQQAGVKHVKVRIEYGNPNVMIPIKVATEERVDLIVCGATGRNAIERFIVGSVSQNILKYAKCDVLVIK